MATMLAHNLHRDVSEVRLFELGTVFTGSAIILVILCLDVAILGPHSTGRSLETVTPAGAPQPGGSSRVPSSG